MSGYLGRLLQAAARGEQRLHPMAGSVYGERIAEMEPSPRPELDTPLRVAQLQSGSVEALLSPLARTRAPQLMTFPETRDMPQPRLDPHRFGMSELSAPAGLDSSAARPRDPIRVVMAAEEPLVAVRSAHDPAATTINATQIHGRLQVQHPRSEAFAARPDDKAGDWSPAGVMDKASTTDEQMKRHTAPPFAVETGVRQPDRYHRATRHQRAEEPEVQVHIGRIEVLAVQPPAPPAPTPRRETATRLADYLAARNGSGR
jgi:hypothetical protein